MKTDDCREAFEKWEDSDAADFLDDDNESRASIAEKVWQAAWQAAQSRIEAANTDDAELTMQAHAVLTALEHGKHITQQPMCAKVTMYILTQDQVETIRKYVMDTHRYATAPPPTDEQRGKALDDLEVLKKAWDEDQIDVSGKFVQLHYSIVKAALQSPPVQGAPKEVVDILDQIRKSGFDSYDGLPPHRLAVKALALIGYNTGIAKITEEEKRAPRALLTDGKGE